MGAYKFINVFRVNQIANLASSVDPVHWLTGQSVPESDASISCTTTAAHGSMLMRWPRYSFHSCHVLTELDLRLIEVVFAPNHQFVIVTSWGELLLVWAPFESTDFLLVAFQLGEVVDLLSHISVQNGLISRPTAQERVVPSYATYSSFVAFELFHYFLFIDIPVLKNATRSSHRQEFARVAPRNAGDGVLRSKVVQLGNFGSTGAPKINTRPKPNSQNIIAWPINQIEIVIILQSWRIQHFERRFAYFPLLRVRNGQQFVFIEASKRQFFMFDLFGLAQYTFWLMIITHNWCTIALVLLPSLIAKIENIVIMLAILVHLDLALIHHHICLKSAIFVTSHKLQIIVAHHVAILRNSLEALSGFEIVDSIFIQKTVLDHVWIFNVEHGILEKNVVFSQVLTRIHFLNRVRRLTLLIVIVVVRGLQASILVQILRWIQLDFHFAIKCFVHFSILIDGSKWNESVTFKRCKIKFGLFKERFIVLRKLGHLPWQLN